MKFVSGSLFIMIILLLGCDSTFDPIQENEELVFSMNGVLDVHKDTQWVRVMPVDTLLFPTDPEIKPAIVTVRDDVSGERSMLQDSLFRFGNNSFVYNYFFADSLQPNQTYTLTATAGDGRQSKVVVNTPSYLETPVGSYSDQNESAMVTGFTLDSLVVINAKYLAQPVLEFGGCGPETELSFSMMDQLEHNTNGEYFTSNEYSDAIGRALSTRFFVINKRSIEVAIATSDWPNTSVLDEFEVVIPGVVSNVENGTGVVAGIASKEIVLSPRQPPC